MAGNAVPMHAFLDVLATAFETLFTANGKVGLFTAPATLTPDNVLADMIQPTFTGYAVSPFTPGTRRGNANGDIIIPLGTQTFQPTADPASPETVIGFFIQGGVTPVLYFAELLPSAWVVASTLDALDLVLEYYQTADSVYGTLCTSCST